jgi:P-type Cu2+ transporter
MECCPQNKDVAQNTAKDTNDGVIYTCPMHPEIERPRPGMCPECGMSLVPRVGGSNHGDGPKKHASHSTSAFLRKFWVALVLSIPLVLYSELPELFFGIRAPSFQGEDLVMLFIGSFVFFYAGSVFLMSAYRELRARLPGMMTLIAIAISAAFLWSVYATFFDEMTLWWELGTLVAIMLLGHWIEMRSVQSAKGAIQELASLLPAEAEVERDGQSLRIPIEELEAGDLVVVKPGERIPADGLVESGSSELDESIVTGESRPVFKESGDNVIAGTINGDGGLKIRVQSVGEDTFISGVMRLVSEAEASKSRLQLLSDRAAFWLTIVALGVGALSFISWLAVGSEVSFAVLRLVAVLVIACPHALGLAVPLVASISSSLAAKSGFIVKDRLALESARLVDTVLFDKTGTLTMGQFGLSAIYPTESVAPEEVLKFAASVNQGSEHSIAGGILRAAKEQKIELESVEKFERLPGRGVRGLVGGRKVEVGTENLLPDPEIKYVGLNQDEMRQAEAQGQSIIYVIVDGVYIGAVALADEIRPESKEAVSSLHEQGLRVVMVTGDSPEVAEWVANELGIDEYFARVQPAEKVEKVRLLQERGYSVAMVGDGVNDAPALAKATLGVAIGAGTNVAIESAGIILVKNDPRDISKIIRLSRLTYRKMVQNLFWATGYNIVALPLAAGVLWSWGVVVDPAIGAILMSISTVIVAVNAVLLRRTELVPRVS